MAVRRRRKIKYPRRAANSAKRTRVIVVVLLCLVFLLLCAVVSVAVGLMLGERADENSDLGGKDYGLSEQEYTSGSKTVRSVYAGYASLNREPSHYADGGADEISVCIREPDGTVPYSSPVAQACGFDGVGAAELGEYISEAHAEGMYVCAYFYSSWQTESDLNLMRIKRAYELSLISEALSTGVDDLLILGLGTSADMLDLTESFLSEAALLSESAPVGATVSLEVLSLADTGDHTALAVRESCDYIALDVSAAEMAEEGALEALLDGICHRIELYSVRLLVKGIDYSTYDDAVTLGVKNVQEAYE